MTKITKIISNKLSIYYEDETKDVKKKKETRMTIDSTAWIRKTVQLKSYCSYRIEFRNFFSTFNPFASFLTFPRNAFNRLLAWNLRKISPANIRSNPFRNEPEMRETFSVEDVQKISTPPPMKGICSLRSYICLAILE